MPRPNTTFNLDVDDIEVIEAAMRAQAISLANERLALCDENPADLIKIRKVEAAIRRVEEALGQLHSQKVFYRPTKTVYVGG